MGKEVNSRAYKYNGRVIVMEKAQLYVGFALNSLTKEAQAVTSKNDSLAILEIKDYRARQEGLEASPNAYKKGLNLHTHT
ncbi:hypothetical protein Tco_0243650 [Tanacetum coccineum]